MSLRYIYLFFILLISFMAIALFYNNIKVQKIINVRFKRNTFNSFMASFTNHMVGDETDSLLVSSGLRLTSLTYNSVRYCFFVIWLLVITFSALTNGYIQIMQLMTCIILFFGSTPKMTILGHKSPFAYFTDALTSNYHRKKNNEVFRALSQLKNLSIATQNTHIGSDFIIIELMKYSKLTKPVFATMLKYWRENEKQTACDYFAKTIDTREGKELANVFLKLDNLSPNDMKNQILLCQTIFKEERRTAKEKHNDNRGYVLYGVVVICLLIVLLNFVTMVLYLTTLENFKNITNTRLP